MPKPIFHYKEQTHSIAKREPERNVPEYGVTTVHPHPLSDICNVDYGYQEETDSIKSVVVV